MVVLPLLPLVSLGLDFSFLRYASLLDDRKKINTFFVFSLVHGSVISIILTLLMVFLSDYIALADSNSNSSLYIKVLSLLFVLDFLNRLFQNYSRVIGRNKIFAYSGLLRAVMVFVIAYGLSFIIDGWAYVFALIVSPLISVLFIYIFLAKSLKEGVVSNQSGWSDFYKFGVYTGFGSVISQLQMPMAGVMLGWMGSGYEVALYRVASLIPISLLFIPNLFLKSEFVYLSKTYADKSLVKNYIVNYAKLAVLFSLVMILVGMFLGAFIVQFLFGEQYSAASGPFKILLLGVAGGIILRQLFGNLTYAAGKSGLNVINAVLNFIFGLILTYFLISYFGVYGAVASTAFMLWFSGISNAIIYYCFVYRRLV
jgi:O-antigen/teichoic acid export membrane protein